MNFTSIEFGTPEYDDTVALRTEVLRKPLNLEFFPEDLALEYDQFHFGLYDDHHNLLGCLILKEAGAETIKMRQVAVSEKMQRKGIGKKMVQESEFWASQKGYKVIELSAREGAVEFYKSMDYTVEGDRFVEVGIPHFHMKKII